MNHHKIFYISPQRCGTKSFGEFFRRNNYPVASWKTSMRNQWSHKALEGQFDAILESEDFVDHAVFEDGPWFAVDLVKFVYHRIPESRFVYFHRPVEEWFRSMLSHSNGRVPGVTKRHCQLYNRLDHYYAALKQGPVAEMNGLSLEGLFGHYQAQFEQHWLQFKAFFEDKPESRFFTAALSDPDKYARMNAAWDLGLKETADVHIHKSPAQEGETEEPPVREEGFLRRLFSRAR